MIDPYSLSVIVFFAILGILIYKDRKHIEFKYVVVMRRTKRFRKFIDRIARKSPLLWKVIGTIAIVVCFYYMISGLYIIFNLAYRIYLGEITQPTLQFIFPIPSSQTVSGPGFIGIPFWFWVIVIAAILIPHELSHGVIARAEKIKLKNVGLLLLLVQYVSIPVVIVYFIYTGTFDFILFLVALLLSFPGAFVEPDEKQIEKSKLITKLRIFSSGSFTNILTSFLILLLAQSLLWSSFVQPGIIITSVNETTPGGQLGLEPGMILQSIDQKKLELNFLEYSSFIFILPNSTSEEITDYTASILLWSALSGHKPGDNVTLEVDGIDYNLTLGEHPSIENFPYIGVTTSLNTNRIDLFFVLFPLLAMIAILSMAVGIINILPIYPLDGGLMIKAITDKYAKERSKQIFMGITYFVLLLLFYSFIGPFL